MVQSPSPKHIRHMVCVCVRYTCMIVKFEVLIFNEKAVVPSVQRLNNAKDRRCDLKVCVLLLLISSCGAAHAHKAKWASRSGQFATIWNVHK